MSTLVPRLPRRSFAAALFASLGVGVASAALVRSRARHWGASRDEARRALPGDDLIAAPRLESTRAVTIAAPREEVWPWLVQIGQGRGGFSSSTFLEHLVGADIHHAERVETQWQDLREGDVVRMTSPNLGENLGLHVVRVSPPSALVLRAGPADRPAFVWTFVLYDVAADTTRLVVRCRFDIPSSLRAFVTWRVLTEPAHFVMERRMLLGLRARAERRFHDLLEEAVPTVGMVERPHEEAEPIHR